MGDARLLHAGGCPARCCNVVIYRDKAAPAPASDLFARAPRAADRESLAPGACVLRAFALGREAALLAALAEIAYAAPFRRMTTPGGIRMSVAMTNCGDLGWITDRHGYRYDTIDPLSGQRWPAMPRVFLDMANDAAATAGFAHFVPDACLVNRYEPGARLNLHQDRDEHDFSAPIVSVSLGLPATFLFGGNARAERQQRIPLAHGDVVVWGGPARMRHHGICTLKAGHHERLGAQRINLTLRKAS